MNDLVQREIPTARLRPRGAGLIATGLLLAVVLLPAGVMAATPVSSGFRIAPGIVLLPSFGVDAVYTDNFYYQPNDQHQETVMGWQIMPGLTLLGDAGRYSFRLDAGAKSAMFDAVGDADDYFDHSVNGSFSWSLTAKNALTLTASHKRGHDPFGEERTEVATFSLGRDLDEWARYGAGVVYSYGGLGSRFGLNLGYHVVGKDYKTNRDLGTRFLDYNTQTASITGLYHYSGKTTFILGYQHTDVHLAHEIFVLRGGASNLYLAGVKWKATGKTSGDARVGYISREFNEGGLDHFGKVAWRVGVTWSPVARAQLRLETGRQPQVSYFIGSTFIDNQYYRAKFTYDWTGRFQTVLGYRHTKQDFVSTSRQDKLNTYSLTGRYMLTALWDFTVGVFSSHRDSDFTGADYDRNYVRVGLRYAR